VSVPPPKLHRVTVGSVGPRDRERVAPTTTHAFPQLGHLLTMTDDVGLFQHAMRDIPNRRAGYCLDDVGRGLIVAVDAARRAATADAGAQLVRTYLSYLHDSQQPDGWFWGFLGFDRRWQDDGATPDAFGRALWGLGYAERFAPLASWRDIAGALRRAAMPGLARLDHKRSRAYAALGLAHALAAEPDDAADVRAGLLACAGFIDVLYVEERGADWEWCEDIMTYDNARLPEALMRAGSLLGAPDLIAHGLEMLTFLARETTAGNPSQSRGPVTFVPVGNQGWYPRGGTKAANGQQPLEAWAMVDAALLAHSLTGDDRWRELAEVAHAWFAGANTAGLPLADPIRGGCADGLDGQTVNANMGAESTLAYLASANAMARDSGGLRVAR